jgi:hypothetical protein
MYKVIKSFSDLQDNGFVYKAGDIFPRLGKEVTENRLKELSSKENKRGEKLIEGEPEPVEEIIEKEAPVERRRRRKNARADSQVD